MSIKYDLEADWALLDTCNYRCTYCFFPPEALGRKLRTFATAQEWREAFDTLGLTCLLHITGGEPSIYPEFAEFCATLTQRHYVSLNTNLTHGSLARFAQIIDPSRVSFINAALHLQERERHSGHAVFLRHADMLRSKDFPIFVTLVATPAALARFDEAAHLLRSIGLGVVPKLFRGQVDGRVYPKSYTESEKRRFRELCTEARQAYWPSFERRNGWPTLDLFHDDEHLDGIPIFKGLSCSAGQRFVRIMPNGDVIRCSAEKLGNILERSFRPRRRPAQCDTEFCFYFCKKYSLPDRPWLAQQIDHWQGRIDSFAAGRAAIS